MRLSLVFAFSAFFSSLFGFDSCQSAPEALELSVGDSDFLRGYVFFFVFLRFPAVSSQLLISLRFLL